MKRCLVLSAVLAGVSVPCAFGHFPMLIHDAPFAEVNQVVNLMFAVGHPYEQEYADAPKPEKVVAIEPSGTVTELSESLVEGTHTVDNVTAKVWNLAYKADHSGDTVIALDSEPEFRLNNVLYQEYLKIFVHAEESEGWQHRTGQPLEIVPLTRPYGLEEGFVFTGRLMKGDEPVSGAEIEIEQFLTRVPRVEDLPPEPLITKVVVTDPNGVFSHTLPNPGWWICAAHVENLGEVTRDGQTYTLSPLAGIWIHVEEKFVQKFPTVVGKWQGR